MDASQWEKLEALFIAALELAPEARATFLDEACENDPELRKELDSMLSTDEASVALALESRLLTREAPTLPEPETLIGSRIGPYRIEKRIGQGGMGEVYLARRDDDQFEQSVALKLIRPGYRSSQMLARFRMERQVLARLTHPNITQLLDGGIDNDGRPYLVMQYVEGISITSFCDKHALSIEERLNLFRTVCAAVQHAHRNLIVHRDLKPSNILVTEEGEVKLLDFGIAKLLDPEWGGTVAVTQSQLRLMTPEYAAPEQVRGEAITTATDVYALGVLLYELLCGRRPYRLSNRMQAEIERIVCDVMPTRPSTAITEAAPDADHQRASHPEDISRARRTVLSRLKKTLQGDLDNIVLMALRKEPARRYASAAQFSEDVKRYLSGRPVQAQKDHVAYRFRKFVHRNRRLVTVAAVALLFIVGFGVVMTIQAVRISNQAMTLAQERDRAQREAEKANQVVTFLEDLFEASNPFQPVSERRDTLQVRDFLSLGIAHVEQELAAQPEIQASLLDVLGHVQRSLGNLQDAEPILEKALQLRRQVLTAPHVELAESMAEMAGLYFDKGDYAAAEPLLQDAKAMLQTLLGPTHPDVADAFNRLGALRQAQGDYALAESLYTTAHDIHRQTFGDTHHKAASDLNNLASIFYLQGRYDEAEPLFRRVIDIRTQVLGPEHPFVAEAMSNLGNVYHGQKRYEETETLYRGALAINRKVLAPNHPRVANGMSNLGVLLKNKGDHEEAEQLYRQSLALYRDIYGASHPTIALNLHNLGALLKARGDFDAAVAMYEEALAMRRQLLGNVHPSTAATLNNLGVLYKTQRNYEAAEPLLQEALAINRELLDEGHPRIGLTLDTLGNLLLETGKTSQAETALREALDIFTSVFGEDHSYTKKTKASLEQLLAENLSPR